DKGVLSVAAEGFGAPGVVVSYTADPDVQNGKKFAAQGMQIAAGVPLQCDEPADFRTFRLGLFGLDKLYDVDGTLARLARVIDQVI
ncbi:MAG: alanine--glyoxylate aminotransferase family protein, partial [Roseobacter sp.]|nr:alanine--glyoxylate aminotransferase family protein [Roseobacter sp.]